MPTTQQWSHSRQIMSTHSSVKFCQSLDSMLSKYFIENHQLALLEETMPDQQAFSVIVKIHLGLCSFF